MQANMHEAKSKLSQLVETALKGEEVIIARCGKPAVKLVPFKPSGRRVFGLYKGQIKISENFDSDATQNEIAEEFGV
ncbi:type II toxin-antitoxin system Phd/YefM family antitoxin [Agaribacter flavus]|uniref:Antitoxin n=1 Tax=Agaribacter flavus TaxID=1902781 RepID=A0ABV7FM97_9ALTE